MMRAPKVHCEAKESAFGGIFFINIIPRHYSNYQNNIHHLQQEFLT